MSNTRMHQCSRQTRRLAGSWLRPWVLEPLFANRATFTIASFQMPRASRQVAARASSKGLAAPGRPSWRTSSHSSSLEDALDLYRQACNKDGNIQIARKILASASDLNHSPGPCLRPGSLERPLPTSPSCVSKARAVAERCSAALNALLDKNGAVETKSRGPYSWSP